MNNREQNTFMFGKVNKGTLGHLFKSSRVKYNITIEEAAEELYINKKHLIALENEDFEGLPYFIFAKGFALKYASFLQLDQSQISSLFDNVYPDELKQEKIDKTYHDAPSMGTIFRGNNRKMKINPFLIFISFFVFALLIALISIMSSAKQKQKQVDAVEKSEEFSELDQRQGAYVEPKDVGASGSAIHLSEEHKPPETKADVERHQQKLTQPVEEELE